MHTVSILVPIVSLCALWANALPAPKPAAEPTPEPVAAAEAKPAPKVLILRDACKEVNSNYIMEACGVAWQHNQSCIPSCVVARHEDGNEHVVIEVPEGEKVIEGDSA